MVKKTIKTSAAKNAEYDQNDGSLQTTVTRPIASSLKRVVGMVVLGVAGFNLLLMRHDIRLLDSVSAFASTTMASMALSEIAFANATDAENGETIVKDDNSIASRAFENRQQDKSQLLPVVEPQPTETLGQISDKGNAPSETGLEPTMTTDWKGQLRQASQKALQRMEERKAFVTPYATRQSVLQHGFLTQWEDCTIHNLLESKQQRTANNNNNNDSSLEVVIRVVVLGGSCSARAANNCTDETGELLTGRYSNVLQKLLNGDRHHANHNKNGKNNISLEVQIYNMAQGSTNSMLNGATLDTLVDPTQADILVWEFSPNEGWGKDRSDPRKLQFWLTRVQALFQQRGMPLPPIFVIFLWERNIGLPKKRQILLSGGLSASGKNALPFLEYYKQDYEPRWNIHAINIGATAVNLTALADDPTMLIDDEIHPNCHTVHLMADMIQHALHSNVANCNDVGSRSSNINNDSSMAKKPMHVSLNYTVIPPPPPPAQELEQNPILNELWNLMIDPTVRVSSFTPWEPNVGRSTLHVHNLTHIQNTWPTLMTEKTYRWRDDRKKGYALPYCEDTERSAADGTTPSRPTITLLEPQLAFLGIGITKKGLIRAFINGMEVEMAENRKFRGVLGFGYLNRWVQIPSSSEGVPAASNYAIAFCDAGGRGKASLRQLVAVIRP